MTVMSSTYLTISFVILLVFFSTVYGAFRQFDDGCGGQVRIRKDWRSLSLRERHVYLSSMVRLMQRRTSPTYKEFVDTHLHASSYGHGTPWFFPWHRFYIWRLESVLRWVARNDLRFPQSDVCSLALHYWSFEKDSDFRSTRATPAPFTNDAFGSRPRDNTFQCGLADGYFNRSWHRLTDSNNAVTCDNCGRRQPCSLLSRYFDDNYSPLLESTVSDRISSSANSAFRAFWEWVETTPHSSAHMTVGGNMATMSSPEDPVFFLLHSCVDRYWTIWIDMRDIEKLPASSLRADTHFATPTSDERTLMYTIGSTVTARGVGFDDCLPFPSMSGLWNDVDNPSNCITPRKMYNIGTKTQRGVDNMYYRYQSQDNLLQQITSYRRGYSISNFNLFVDSDDDDDQSPPPPPPSSPTPPPRPSPQSSPTPSPPPTQPSPTPSPVVTPTPPPRPSPTPPPPSIPSPTPDQSSDRCSRITTCSQCTQTMPCGWCVSSQYPNGACIEGGETGPSRGHCKTSWNYFSCPSRFIDCTAQNSCGNCIRLAGCGWCKQTGECVSGSRKGSTTCPMRDPSRDWSWDSCSNKKRSDETNDEKSSEIDSITGNTDIHPLKLQEMNGLSNTKRFLQNSWNFLEDNTDNATNEDSNVVDEDALYAVPNEIPGVYSCKGTNVLRKAIDLSQEYQQLSDEKKLEILQFQECELYQHKSYASDRWITLNHFKRTTDWWIPVCKKVHSTSALMGDEAYVVTASNASWLLIAFISVVVVLIIIIIILAWNLIQTKKEVKGRFNVGMT